MDKEYYSHLLLKQHGLRIEKDRIERELAIIDEQIVQAHEIDQEYCFHHYWDDYPRADKVRIDDTRMTEEEKNRIRAGSNMVINRGLFGGWYESFRLAPDIDVVVG